MIKKTLPIVINSTDEENLYIIDALGIERWIWLRNIVPRADYNFPNMALYLIKMLIFKCMDLGMEGEEIMDLFDINVRAYDKDVLKYFGYCRIKKIIYPNFIDGAKNVSDIRTVTEKYLESQKNYGSNKKYLKE